jgi:hypothetical protein
MSPTRALFYARKLVEKYQIDCTGLTILTEAASGSYFFNPLIPIVANANSVITFCKSSSYGNVEEIEKEMSDVYSELGYRDNYHFHKILNRELLCKADIVTNSGHLRPLDEAFIGSLKDTAVIPLMWEPWEIREGEIDLLKAKERNILIMGTNEHAAPCDMRPYGLLTALHLMMEHKASIVDDRILLIGSQPTLALPIEKGLSSLDVACKRIGTDESKSEIQKALKWANYILIAEHSDNRIIIGKKGIIETEMILTNNICGVGVISGSVDTSSLLDRGISVFPESIAPHGYMSYSPCEIGPYGVMDLFAAGIKVGQTMANCRLSGMDVEAAAKCTLDEAPALDLTGEWAWVKN